MDRNRLDDEPYDQYAPTPGASFDNPFRGSASYRQFDWAKEHPKIANALGDLLGYIGVLPMGRSSGAGGIMRDNVIAGRLGRLGDEPAIRGGTRTKYIGNKEFEVSTPDYWRTAQGLAREKGMVPAEEPLYRPGAYGDRHPGASEPANNNKGLQIDDPYMELSQDQRAYQQAVIDQQWADMVRRSRQPQLDVISGGIGKKD